MLDLLAYAKSHGNEKFRWHTSERLADFMTQRRGVQWTEWRHKSGARHFKASHPVALREMVWILPKTACPLLPAIVTGAASVTDERAHWRVRRETARRLNSPPCSCASDAAPASF